MNRRQQAFDASTNRDPYLFERVEAEIIDQAAHQTDPAPGRGRGRRGGRRGGRARKGRTWGAITRGLALRLAATVDNSATATATAS